jgi:hypothetical protein
LFITILIIPQMVLISAGEIEVPVGKDSTRSEISSVTGNESSDRWDR